QARKETINEEFERPTLPLTDMQPVLEEVPSPKRFLNSNSFLPKFYERERTLIFVGIEQARKETIIENVQQRNVPVTDKSAIIEEVPSPKRFLHSRLI